MIIIFQIPSQKRCFLGGCFWGSSHTYSRLGVLNACRYKLGSDDTVFICFPLPMTHPWDDCIFLGKCRSSVDIPMYYTWSTFITGLQFARPDKFRSKQSQILQICQFSGHRRGLEGSLFWKKLYIGWIFWSKQNLIGNLNPREMNHSPIVVLSEATSRTMKIRVCEWLRFFNGRKWSAHRPVVIGSEKCIVEKFPFIPIFPCDDSPGEVKWNWLKHFECKAV